MMFVWWLMKRAWKPIIGFWNKPAIDGVQCSGKEDIFFYAILVCWASSMTLSVVLTFWFNDIRFLWLTALILCSIVPIAYVPTAYKYLSKLHAQYHAETTQNKKPKRKRKPDFRNARGCLAELFEDDPRPSEEIVRDYRDRQNESIGSFFDGYDTASKYIDDLFESDGE